MVTGLGGGDMDSLLKLAQDMQRRSEQVQSELKERVVEGTAGGGAVRCRMTGQLELQAIEIDPEVVDPKDVQGLEDLITAAVRQAVDAANRLRKTELAKITGGMNLPGLF